MRTFLNTWHNMGVVALQNSRIATQTFLLGKQTEEEREGEVDGASHKWRVEPWLGESGHMRIVPRREAIEASQKMNGCVFLIHEAGHRELVGWKASQTEVSIVLMRSQSWGQLDWRETSRGSLNVCEPSPIILGVVEWIVCDTRQSIVGYQVQAIWSETCASETVMAKLVGMRWRYKREKRMEIPRHMKVQVRA